MAGGIWSPTMHYPGIRWILAFSVAAVPLGCDSGDGDDDGSSTAMTVPMTSTNPTDGGETTAETGDTAEMVTYADVEAIWTGTEGSCVAGCHTAGGTGDSLTMLVLTPGMGYAELVGPMANQLPTMPLVTPGNPSMSYLWHKLDGTQQQVGGSGILMPQGRPKLPEDQLAIVKAWIEGGALP